MQRRDFRFELPEDLIAHHPPARRGGGRLLHVDGAQRSMVDRTFDELPGLLREGDLLVVNDTRVVPARLHGVKPSGGRVEVLLERVSGPRRALVQVRASKPPRIGGSLVFAAGASAATVVARHQDFWELEFDDEALAVFERHGQVQKPRNVDDLRSLELDHEAAEPEDEERGDDGGQHVGVHGSLILAVAGVDDARAGLALLVVAERAERAKEIPAQLPVQLGLVLLPLPAEPRCGLREAMPHEGFERSALIASDLIGGKFFRVFGLDLSVGMIPFPLTFVLTDIVNEFYGSDGARRSGTDPGNPRMGAIEWVRSQRPRSRTSCRSGRASTSRRRRNNSSPFPERSRRGIREPGQARDRRER
jgi:hypothetical protein